jgi:hypothetical protein
LTCIGSRTWRAEASSVTSKASKAHLDRMEHVAPVSTSARRSRLKMRSVVKYGGCWSTRGETTSYTLACGAANLG